MEILTFFYGPVGVLLMINLALFALTARELTCGLWKRELVKSTSERAALGRVCMKLVVVMGVSWIADVLSWIVGGPQELWYLTDLINCFQGVFIFIVVGCQPQVLSAVKRLWCFRKHRANGTAGTTNHHSSSSQGMPSMGDTVTNHSVTNNTTKSIPLETSC
jgi:G protein-coupled receptor Mth (Methuselah protein)